MCQYFYPETISSASLPTATATHLSQEGYSVEVLCGYPAGYSSRDLSRREEYLGIVINRVRYITESQKTRFGRLLKFFTFILAISVRFCFLRKFRTIIVYSNPPVIPIVASFASRIFRNKVVFVCYDVYPEIAYATSKLREGELLSKIMEYVNREVFRNSTRVIALSQDMSRFLLFNRPSMTVDKIVVIPNWHEDNKSNKRNSAFAEYIKSMRNGKMSDSFIVSYFGNMGIAQDMDTIINAIRLLRCETDIRFLFAGHGEKMQELKRIVSNEHLYNVDVFDFLNGQDFADALNVSSCFIFSLVQGIGNYAVPSKVSSYLMAGKPVVAIVDDDMEIIRQIGSYNAGCIIGNGKSQRLAESIAFLRDNPSICIEKSLNSRRLYIEHYSREDGLKKYTRVMREILS